MERAEGEYSYYYDEAVLKHFPPEKTAKILFQALDALEEPVIIIDKYTAVGYINSSYVKKYEPFLKSKELFFESRNNWKLTDVGSRKDSAEILAVLKGKTYAPKYYSTMSNQITSFTDIIPLKDGREILGAIVIIRDVTEVAKMSHEMNHYRTVANELRRELDAKQELPIAFRSIIGSSQEFISLLHIAARVAQSNAAVCLTGESGTGKEVLAKAIHYSSKVAGGPMIKVNCAAIPETLIESEMFGYENGAFTGAKTSGSPGKFELANGGTLFLDEIGEMPLSMQVKLLRVLQEREITRIGGAKTVKLNFRLITATNRDLETMVKAGEFREDLFYRINVIPLTIPPLQARKDDIPVLIDHFLNEIKAQGGGDKSFNQETVKLMCNYSWPGNIRELKNCVERMAILSVDDVISSEWLPNQILNSGAERLQNPEKYYRLQTILERTERDTIRAVLNMTNQNRSKAIEILGLSRRNFYMKLEKYNIK